MFDFLQICGGLILAVGYLPQIYKICVIRSAADFTLKTYILARLGIALMEAYAVHLVWDGSGLMFLVTNTLSLAIMSVMVGLIAGFQYKNKFVRPAPTILTIWDPIENEIVCVLEINRYDGLVKCIAAKAAEDYHAAPRESLLDDTIFQRLKEAGYNPKNMEWEIVNVFE